MNEEIGDLLFNSLRVESCEYSNIISKEHLRRMCMEISSAERCMTIHAESLVGGWSDDLSFVSVSTSPNASASMELTEGGSVLAVSLGLILKAYALARCTVRHLERADMDQFAFVGNSTAGMLLPAKEPFFVDSRGCGSSLEQLDERCAQLPPNPTADRVADAIAVNAGQFALLHEYSHHFLGHAGHREVPTKEVKHGLELLADREAWIALVRGASQGQTVGLTAPGESLTEALQRRVARGFWYLLAVIGEGGDTHPSAVERYSALSALCSQMFGNADEFWRNTTLDTLMLLSLEGREVSEVPLVELAHQGAKDSYPKMVAATEWVASKHEGDPRRNIKGIAQSFE